MPLFDNRSECSGDGNAGQNGGERAFAPASTNGGYACAYLDGDRTHSRQPRCTKHQSVPYHQTGSDQSSEPEKITVEAAKNDGD